MHWRRSGRPRPNVEKNPKLPLLKKKKKGGQNGWKIKLARGEGDGEMRRITRTMIPMMRTTMVRAPQQVSGLVVKSSKQ